MDHDDEQPDVTADSGPPAAEVMGPQAVAELSQELTLVARALFAQLLPSTAAHAVTGVGQAGESASAVAHAAGETTAQHGGPAVDSSGPPLAPPAAAPAAVPVPGQIPLPLTPPPAAAVVPASIAVPAVSAPGLAPAPEQEVPAPAAVAVPGLAPTPDAAPSPIPVPQATVPVPEAVPGTASDADSDAGSGSDRATSGPRRGVRSLALLEEISFLEE